MTELVFTPKYTVSFNIKNGVNRIIFIQLQSYW